MKFYLPFVLAGASLLAGCKGINNEASEKLDENDKQIQAYIASNNLAPTKSPSGLYYQLKNTIPTARAPKEAELVYYTRVISQLNNKVVGDTTNKIFKGYFGYTTGPLAVHEGLSYMKEGESSVLLSPYSIAFGMDAIKDTLGNVLLPAYAPVRFDLKLIKTRNESEQIQDYIAENKLQVTGSTTDNLNYIRLKEGTGSTIAAGKAVVVKYVGKLVTGAVFDKSDSFSFTVGVTSLVSGFTQGVQKMKVGEKAIIIFPSALGYGVNGRRDGYGQYVIYPSVPLIFELEVLSAN
ncbi:FKBP-type peptidyl-prolyl cis-trans isomerase [Siphonobacter sp. SORGH_AS_0500]|uniref:FKBP-type peptidyl-prolyl cis-trans isomerase n=1 Tax=Siphonobacter sp. SORGH_AS_0500 TaxID=1864824 RepID=UPI002864FFE8|nr:FKBP-type peptidyl-prolyl cis-trans isomerase [Siphonobacter sp. SORGH_AS_0500]MDR6193730.1 FKBP-type peptidyl-prolyl cis-trans isomerase [Siphonobacter sp. SORGH_AS_0500]